MARKKRKVRFARVPNGPDSCDWCNMLASRGAVYTSAEAAGELNHFHNNCHCVIVPSWGGSAIEGYEPDEYYDRWKHPEIYKGLDEVTSKALACLRVAEKRGQVVYEKPLLSFLETDGGKRDLFAHEALARDGRRFRALVEDAPDGFSNIDLEMDGAFWEVKSPPGSGIRAVESNLRKAKDQFEKHWPEPVREVRVVFNGRFYGQDDIWTSEKLSLEASRHGIAEVILVDKVGNVRQIEKARVPYPERPSLQTSNSISHSASSMEEHRSPKPTNEVQSLGGVPEKRVPGNTHLKTGNMTSAEYAEYRRELEAVRSMEQVWLPPDEYAMFMSEVNTHLSDEDRKHALVRKAIGNTLYTFINRGFNDYTVVGVKPIR